MDICPLGRRVHSASGGRDFRLDVMAMGIRAVWSYRNHWAAFLVAWFRITPAITKVSNAAELAFSGHEKYACPGRW